MGESSRRWFEIILSTNYTRRDDRKELWEKEEDEIYRSCSGLFIRFTFQREGTSKQFTYRIIGRTRSRKRCLQITNVLQNDISNIDTIECKPIDINIDLYDYVYVPDKRRMAGPWCAYRVINKLVYLSVNIAKWALDYGLDTDDHLRLLTKEEQNFHSLTLHERVKFRKYIEDIQLQKVPKKKS